MYTSSHDLSRHVWRTRYRDPDAALSEDSLEATWDRVARAAAAAEANPDFWYPQFLRVLQDFRFLPGGRILAGAGTTHPVTLANCFVMGRIDNSIAGIFEALQEGAITICQGGGVGYDFSTLRPRDTSARTADRISAGPVAFMNLWNAMCDAFMPHGVRETAMMASLRCDHPDIEAFIDARRRPGDLKHFNLSVQVTDEFMRAVSNDDPWALVFPSEVGSVPRVWSGSTTPLGCEIHRTVSARALWKRLCEAAHDCAEPGVLFIDRLNAQNNLAYCEQLTSTNPCAEEPLPEHGACNLGSLNLAAFVLNPFSPTAEISQPALTDAVRVAVRFLDDVIDLTHYPLRIQQETARKSRRIGLGITGLADALAMLGLRYDSEPARAEAARIMSVIRDSAYSTSVELANERGSFPLFKSELYLERPFIKALTKELRDEIERYGIRNSHLLAIAPAGAISLLANNVSSGMEPIAGIETLRHSMQVTDYAYALWRQTHGPAATKPEYFVEADAVSPRDQLLMQAALAPFVDGSISKSISLPRSFSPEGVADLFSTAYLLGLKGCTVFNQTMRAVATPTPSAEEYGRTAERSND